MIPFKRLLVLIAIASWMPLSLCAEELDGVSFPDAIRTTAGATLYLNGLGIRKATILRVHVYVAALYVGERTKDAQAVINGKGERRLILSFVRDVEKQEVAEAWEKGFRDNNPDADQFGEELAKLIASTVSMKNGDTVTLRATDEGLSVSDTAGGSFSSDNPLFARAVLRIWLGDSPPNGGLKDGLLGID